MLYRTPFGLRLRAVGENPEAADAAGVSVARVRYAGVMLSGALAAIGGAYLSIGQSSLFTRNMTAGRGFIALAALIFGKWRPVQTMLACLLFGFAEALSIQMQGVVKLPSGEDIPVQFIQMIPYVLTIVVLAGFIGHSRPPRALGMPVRERLIADHGPPEGSCNLPATGSGLQGTGNTSSEKLLAGARTSEPEACVFRA